MSFPRYDRYKDSGVEWLGKVPEGWEVRSFKRIASIRYGIGEPPRYQEEGTPLIRATNVNAGKITQKGMVFVNPDDIPEKRIIWLAAGDIIVVRSGAYTGDSAIIRNEHCPCIAGFDMVVHPHSCLSDFLQYSLLSNYLKNDQIDLEKLRAAQPHLNAEELGSCLVALPPSEEQHTITTFLDLETSKIDALVAEQERLIELLKEKRQAVISHAVTRGLNPDAPMKDSGIEWLGEVPEGWEIKQLKHLVRTGTSITYGIVQAGPHYEGGIPYIKTSDMSGDYLPVDGYALTSPEIDFAYVRSKVEKGDLVIAIRATVGKCLPVPDEIVGANLTQGTAKIAPGENIIREFLLFFLNSELSQNYFDHVSKGATFKEITLDSLRRTPIVVPPIFDQSAIVAFLDSETAKIDVLVGETQKTIGLLKERRSALISAAVTGKIDVRVLAGSTPC